jgi:hypothetical protein
MVRDRDKLKKPLKEKGIKSLDDFNSFMRNVSKDFVETHLEEELLTVWVSKDTIKKPISPITQETAYSNGH